MDALTYTIVLQPVEEGGYFVTVPALPGCVTQGDTFEEAVEMAQDAIKLWLGVLVEDGAEIPLETESFEAFETKVTVPSPVHR